MLEKDMDRLINLVDLLATHACMTDAESKYGHEIKIERDLAIFRENLGKIEPRPLNLKDSTVLIADEVD
jgi:hypothetical protein